MTLPSPQPLTLDVGFNLTLDTIVGVQSPRYDTGGEYLGGDALTLLDLIVGDVSRRIADSVMKDDRYEPLKKQVATIRREVIVDRITPLVDDAINGPITLSNSYGEPTGQATTMRALVIAEVQKHMQRSGRNGYEKTPFDKALAEITASALNKELAAQLAAMKAELVEQFRATAAQVIAASVAKQMGVTA